MKRLFNALIISLVICGCNDNDHQDSNFSIELSSLGSSNNVVGNSISCNLSINQLCNDDHFITFSIEEGCGFVEIGEKEYKQGDVIKYPGTESKIPFIYVPTSKGTHSIIFSLKNSAKEVFASINFEIGEPKLTSTIKDIESTVLINNTTEFRLIIDTDLEYIECLPKFVKGYGEILIGDTKYAGIHSQNPVPLEKDNLILFKPTAGGENRIEFLISGKYGKSCIHTIVFIVAE
ncbi:MAG: hypothetical protein LUH22_09735 [Bacteroides sp.]|nr:hypothetical protein [Bacteroides sp.]